MRKETILENMERLEINTFLKMLRMRVEKEIPPVSCNIDLLNKYIKDLDRET